MKWLTDAQYTRLLKDLLKEKSGVLQNCTAAFPLTLRLDDNDDGKYVNVTPGDTIDITAVKTGSTQVFLGLRFRPRGPKTAGHAVTGSLFEVLPSIQTEKGVVMPQALSEIGAERGMTNEKKVVKPKSKGVLHPFSLVEAARALNKVGVPNLFDQNGDLVMPPVTLSGAKDDPVEIPDELIDRLAATRADDFGAF